MSKIRVVKSGELWTIRIGTRRATWGDFGRTPFTYTPAVYQRKSDAEKDARKLRKKARIKS